MQAGYQITQYYKPIAESGWFEFIYEDEASESTTSQSQSPSGAGGAKRSKPRAPAKQLYRKRVHIERIQLEQDSGGALYDTELAPTASPSPSPSPTPAARSALAAAAAEAAGAGAIAPAAAGRASRGRFLVDLNRAGVPLVEIITAPDFTSAAQVCAYVLNLRRLLRALGVSTGNMSGERLLSASASAPDSPSTSTAIYVSTFAPEIRVRLLNLVLHMCMYCRRRNESGRQHLCTPVRLAASALQDRSEERE